MGVFAEAKQEWRHFRGDPPGRRFEKHRERMQHRPRSHGALALGVGVVLLVGGVVLLFMPGPGLLLIVFGLALVASHSERLSRLLDRAEPALRRFGRHAKLRWQAAPGRAKVGLLLGLASAAGAFLVLAWRFVVAAYLLG